MKLISLLLLFVALISPSLLFSQGNTNTKYYSPSQPINAFDYVLNQSDEVFVVGGSAWTENAWFLHLDSIGSIVSAKSYGTGNLKKMLRLTDSTFVAVGDCYAGPTSAGNHAIVLGLSASGDTLWTRELYSSSANSSHAWDVQLAIDSNIFVAGECNNGLNAFVAKLDIAGNVLWNRVFASQEPLSSSFQFLAVQTDSTGAIVLAGQRVSDLQVYGVLMKMQEDGTVLWSKSGGVGSSFQALLALGNEYFGVNAYASTLFKTDSMGTIQWSEYVIPTLNEYSGIEFSLVQETDSTLLLTGHDMWSGSTARVNTAGDMLEHGSLFGKAFKTRKRSDGKFMMMLNGPVYGIKSANVLTPHFGISVLDSLSQALFCSVLQTIIPANVPMSMVNSNVLQTGQLTVSHPSIQVSVLDLLTEDGCIDFWGGVSEQSLLSIDLFPNPVSDVLHVKMEGERPSEYRVFNSCGVEVISGNSLNQEFEIDITHLASGIYLFRVGPSIRKFHVCK